MMGSPRQFEMLLDLSAVEAKIAEINDDADVAKTCAERILSEEVRV